MIHNFKCNLLNVQHTMSILTHNNYVNLTKSKIKTMNSKKYLGNITDKGKK